MASRKHPRETDAYSDDGDGSSYGSDDAEAEDYADSQRTPSPATPMDIDPPSIARRRAAMPISFEVARQYALTQLQNRLEPVKDAVGQPVIRQFQDFRSRLKQLQNKLIEVVFLGTLGAGKSAEVNKLLFPEHHGKLPLPSRFGAASVSKVPVAVRHGQEWKLIAKYDAKVHAKHTQETFCVDALRAEPFEKPPQGGIESAALLWVNAQLQKMNDDLSSVFRPLELKSLFLIELHGPIANLPHDVVLIDCPGDVDADVAQALFRTVSALVLVSSRLATREQLLPLFCGPAFDNAAEFPVLIGTYFPQWADASVIPEDVSELRKANLEIFQQNIDDAAGNAAPEHFFLTADAATRSHLLDEIKRDCALYERTLADHENLAPAPFYDLLRQRVLKRLLWAVWNSVHVFLAAVRRACCPRQADSEALTSRVFDHTRKAIARNWDTISDIDNRWSEIFAQLETWAFRMYRFIPHGRASVEAVAAQFTARLNAILGVYVRQTAVSLKDMKLAADDLSVQNFASRVGPVKKRGAFGSRLQMPATADDDESDDGLRGAAVDERQPPPATESDSAIADLKRLIYAQRVSLDEAERQLMHDVPLPARNLQDEIVKRVLADQAHLMSLDEMSAVSKIADILSTTVDAPWKSVITKVQLKAKDVLQSWIQSAEKVVKVLDKQKPVKREETLILQSEILTELHSVMDGVFQGENPNQTKPHSKNLLDSLPRIDLPQAILAKVKEHTVRHKEFKAVPAKPSAMALTAVVAGDDEVTLQLSWRDASSLAVNLTYSAKVRELLQRFSGFVSGTLATQSVARQCAVCPVFQVVQRGMPARIVLRKDMFCRDPDDLPHAVFYLCEPKQLAECVELAKGRSCTYVVVMPENGCAYNIYLEAAKVLVEFFKWPAWWNLADAVLSTGEYYPGLVRNADCSIPRALYCTQQLMLPVGSHIQHGIVSLVDSNYEELLDEFLEKKPTVEEKNILKAARKKETISLADVQALLPRLKQAGPHCQSVADRIEQALGSFVQIAAVTMVHAAHVLHTHAAHPGVSYTVAVDPVIFEKSFLLYNTLALASFSFLPRRQIQRANFVDKPAQQRAEFVSELKLVNRSVARKLHKAGYRGLNTAQFGWKTEADGAIERRLSSFQSRNQPKPRAKRASTKRLA
eukprot:TRINITY_DN11386_c0_g1_i1.p1 TRINITY_DN11386_c0_g1~~TRINITY_DN11386_c0_g1_i1.p1  ORF type:complete len:1151 (+),score=275.71 TRINITY_DN11386_c0_g1_i1:65-3517(+)